MKLFALFAHRIIRTPVFKILDPPLLTLSYLTPEQKALVTECYQILAEQNQLNSLSWKYQMTDEYTYADIAEFKQLGQLSGMDTVVTAAIIIITATVTIDH